MPPTFHQYFDIETLEIENVEFISKILKRKCVDLLFSVQSRDQSSKAFLLLLTEHLRAPKPEIILRDAEYTVIILRAYWNLQKNQKRKVLPLVYSMATACEGTRK